MISFQLLVGRLSRAVMKAFAPIAEETKANPRIRRNIFGWRGDPDEGRRPQEGFLYLPTNQRK